MNRLQKIILVSVALFFTFLAGGYLYWQHKKEVDRYDFVVQSDQGEVRLKDFRGKKTIVYFGYGLCPDICPTTLSEIARALNMLSPKELDQVRAVFISVDPARDKPKELGVFARYFHPHIIGATADEAYIADLTKRYGASYKKVMLPNSSIGYSVAHSADIYIVGEDGKLKAVLPFGVSAEEIVKNLK